MGLSLGVKLGDNILIANEILLVQDITSEHIVLKHEQRTSSINRSEYIEVLPNVRIRRGEVPGSQQNYPRIDIAAPKAMKISLYRRDRSLNLQQRLVHLCRMVDRGHERPWAVLKRLCDKSHRACRALEAILADPQSPKFGTDWESKFMYLVSSPRAVQGGLPGLGSKR